jgi:hypothetical protein
MQHSDPWREADAELFHCDPPPTSDEQMAELMHHDQRHNKKDQDQEWPYDPTDEPK